MNFWHEHEYSHVGDPQFLCRCHDLLYEYTKNERQIQAQILGEPFLALFEQGTVSYPSTGLHLEGGQAFHQPLVGAFGPLDRGGV